MSDLTRQVEAVEALADRLDAEADRREALYDRDGELLDLGHSDGLRDAAARIRNIITDAERA